MEYQQFLNIVQSTRDKSQSRKTLKTKSLKIYETNWTKDSIYISSSLSFPICFSVHDLAATSYSECKPLSVHHFGLSWQLISVCPP